MDCSEWEHWTFDFNMAYGNQGPEESPEETKLRSYLDAGIDFSEF
jgi:hypothetical protein